MINKTISIVYFIISIIFLSNTYAFAQINISYIDKQITESKTFEFDYYGNYDYLRNVADKGGVSNFNNKLLFNRTIEKTYSGNWQLLNFEIARYNNKGNKTQVTKLDAKLGGKHYLGNLPYFLFGVFEASHYGVKPGPETEKEDIFEGNGIYSFVITGGGGGRVLDIANDIRVRKVQKLLLDRDLIDEELSPDLYDKAKEQLRQKKESSKRVIELNTLLSESGVLNVDRFDVQTVLELTKLLDESADRLESGIEWRVGIGHELSKENSKQDNLRLFGGRIYYGKAFNDRLGFTETMDLIKGWAEKGSGINFKSLAKITYSMVKTELSASYWLTADRREYTVKIIDDSTGTPVTTRNDYDYSKYFNEITLQYSYEIYNKINLSAVFKINRRDYHNDFEITSQKKGWNREFHAMINYEIF